MINIRNIIYLLIVSIFINSNLLFSQNSFCDNFDSYANNTYLASNSPSWTTWTQPYSAVEDVQVTNMQSYSGSNSIYFNGTGNPGGPSDVVLPFGVSAPYTSGNFLFSSQFYVINGAYFNFQAQNTPGVQWALEAEMTNNGIINFTHWNGSSSVNLLSVNYPLSQWFEIQMDIDLDANVWEVIIDGVSQGSFSNPVNQLASLDLYPMTGHQFYIDDICYSHTPTNSSSCLPNETEIIISITTDNYPTETSWQLVDQNGSGWSINPGDLTSPNTTYTYTYCVPDINCYTFTMYDTYGDGICCAWGNGSYYLSYGGLTVASGGSFAGSDITSNIGSCGSNSNCLSNESEIVISITTDDYPSETSWQLVDQNGSGWSINPGDLTNPNTNYTWTYCIDTTDCYDFTIFDTYGDGICCSWGNGSYYVTLDGSTIASGGSFLSSETTPNIGTCLPPSNCPSNETEIVITLTTDDYPNETSWFLVDQFGGGWTNAPLINANTTYTWSICVPDTNCYTFTMLDSYGDGICCAWGNGSYNITYNGIVVGAGGSFSYSEEHCNIGICDPNCQINIPSNAVPEGESCGFDTNHGCDDNWEISNFTITGVTDIWSFGGVVIPNPFGGYFDIGDTPDLYVYMRRNNNYFYYSGYYTDTWYPNNGYGFSSQSLSFSMYAGLNSNPLEVPTSNLFTTPNIIGQSYNYDFSVGDDDFGSFLNLFGNNDYIGSYNLPSFTSSGTFSVTTTGGTNGNAYVDYTVNAPNNIYTPLTNNTTVHGTFYAEGNYRDTDWYEIVISDSADLNVSSISETAYNIYLFEGSNGCDSKILLDSAFALACDSVYIQATIPAGTYWIVVMPSGFSCLPCADSIDYLLDVSWIEGCNILTSVNITPANCISPNGSIDLTVTGGSSPYSYLWSNGSVGQDLLNVPVGNYDVVISTANSSCGDTLSSIYVPDYPSPISLTYTSIPESFAGASDGSIDLSVIGGVPSITYLWSGPNNFSDTSQDINTLISGMYYITVTDQNGCSFYDSIMVLEFSIDVGVSNFISPNNSCVLDSNEQIIVQITNYNVIDATDFIVMFEYNGQIYSDSINVVISPGDSIIHAFSSTINASITGNYSLSAYTSHTLDYSHGNDTSLTTFNNYYHDFYGSDYSMSFEPNEDFTGWLIEDVNNDGYTWNISQYTGFNQSFGVFYNYNFNGVTPANDWLISQCFELEAGNTYTLGFKYRVASASFPEDMTIHIGSSQQGIALNTMLLQMNNLTNIIYDSTQITFTVPFTDVYYIGWHVVSSANMWRIDLDDINISMNLPNVYGCTDTIALNYDPNANVDDGSCIYCIYGCMDSTAFNYDSLATCADLSCVSVMYGCTDSSALNYYAGANVDDGSCIYTIFGCTDPIAINYDPGVLIDDGSCIYTAGCMDSLALNYDPLAVTSDSSCVYPVYGCTDSTAINYDNLANIDDGSCQPYIYGCTDSLALNYYQAANSDDGSCIYPVYGCTDPCNICNYNPLANIDDGSCVYSTSCMSYGCIDPLALNYDSTACYSDSSCVYCVYGCIDSTALNYDSLSTCDDGSCLYVSCGPITGVYVSDITHDRATFHWDNMNNQYCQVDQIRFRYRELGSNSWSTKTMGVPVGSGCNTTNISKLILGLNSSTTYEYDFKIWYCNAATVNWHSSGIFTTSPQCQNVINVTATPINTTKTQFCWDTLSSYEFVRLKYRIDSAGTSFSNIGGFGIFSPLICKDKNGLTPGLSYRVMYRTWCDSNGGSYRSPQWDGPVLWTQPTSIRESVPSVVENLNVYPNPSRGIFNIEFYSQDIQNIEIRILDLLGEVIYQNTLSDFHGDFHYKLDLSNYPKSIYMVEISTDKGVINKKLILQ